MFKRYLTDQRQLATGNWPEQEEVACAAVVCCVFHPVTQDSNRSEFFFFWPAASCQLPAARSP